MKVLLDTQLLVWALISAARVPKEVEAFLVDPETSPLFSSVSVWEVAIKFGLGRPDFRLDPGTFRRTLLENGYGELSMTGRHALEVVNLPKLHRDPFDRILVAQAIAEDVPLWTVDSVLARYPGRVRCV